MVWRWYCKLNTQVIQRTPVTVLHDSNKACKINKNISKFSFLQICFSCIALSVFVQKFKALNLPSFCQLQEERRRRKKKKKSPGAKENLDKNDYDLVCITKAIYHVPYTWWVSRGLHKEVSGPCSEIRHTELQLYSCPILISIDHNKVFQSEGAYYSVKLM